MKQKKYELRVRSTAACPMRDTMLNMIDTLGEGERVKAKSLIGSEKIDGKYAVYLDGLDDESLYGKITSCKDAEDEPLDDYLMEQLIADGNYEIWITGRSGSVISGELVILKSDGSSSKAKEAPISDELRALVEEKIEEKICEREDIEERIKVMKLNHVDERLMMRIIRSYRKYRKPVQRPGCIYVDPFLEQSIKRHEEPRISELLRCAADRYGMVFEGEKSVGKNVCAETIAWLLGMPMRLFTCSRQMTTTTLYGEKTTDNRASKALYSEKSLGRAESLVRVNGGNASEEDIKEAAKFELLKACSASTNIVMEDSELCDWLVDGGVLVLNEMNLCEANLAASFLNPILDGTGFLTVQGRGEIRINPDCVLIGTQNADYVGCEEQNEATMSRLGFFLFEQPGTVKGLLKSAVSAEIKRHGFDITKIAVNSDLIDQADRFYRQCRTSMEKGIISNAALSIRGFARAMAAVAESDGHCRLKRQLQIHVINGCPAEDRLSLIDILGEMITL